MESKEQVVDDLWKVYDSFDKHLNLDVPRFSVAHSFGCISQTHAHMQRPDFFRGLAKLAPLTGLTDYDMIEQQKPFLKVIAKFFPSWAIGKFPLRDKNFPKHLIHFVVDPLAKVNRMTAQTVLVSDEM